MKRVFATMLICAIIIPQVTFAAWWNPFSWNWKALFTEPNSNQIEKLATPHNNNDEAIQDVEITSTTTSIATTPTSTEPLPTIKKVPVLTSPKNNLPANPVSVSPPVVQSQLYIQNVKNDVTRSSAVVTWATTIPTRSQLLLDNGNGRGYESINGVGTTHEVKIENPTPSKEYIYKIIAQSDNGNSTDSYYGAFTAIRDFIPSLITTEDDCSAILLEDTEGKAAVGVSVTVFGTAGASNVVLPRVTVKTNTHGLADLGESYCRKSFNTLKIRLDNGSESQLDF